MTMDRRDVWRRSASGAGVIPLLVACGLILSGCRREPPSPPQGPVPTSQAEAQTLADFQTRIEEYAKIHRRIETGLPDVGKAATPQQIDTTQRELGKLLAAARVDAKQGDLLTPPMQVLIRTHLAEIFRSRQGEDLKGSVMDENPLTSQIGINQRYPDEVPLSTMPPEVLQLLPKMPEELEYRFVGRSLAIMDVHAHMVVDYVANAIPE